MSTPLLRIGIVKGRTFTSALVFLKRHLGLTPQLTHPNDPRCFSFVPDVFQVGSTSFRVNYVLLTPRDVGIYLENHLIDLAVTYDDTLHHLQKKNYHIKPLFPSDTTNHARLCLVGKADVDLTNESNVIFSEYQDAPHFRSSFDVLQDIKGQWMLSHGTTESMVANNLADMCVTVVETGETLRANGLVCLREIRTIYLNILANADTPVGRTVLHHFRPDLVNVVVDGNDGTGKTTLINTLKQDKTLRGFIFFDRGTLTQLTLKDYTEWNPDALGEDVHLVLNNSVETSLVRLRERNAGEEEKHPANKWETLPALSFFKFKFQELCAHYGLPVFDSEHPPAIVAKCVKQYLLSTREDRLAFHYPRLLDWSQEAFDALPLVARGESKIIRSWNAKLDLIQYIPSIYSHKKKRAGFIEGSNLERMTMTRYLLNLLAYENIPHTYIYVGPRFILAHKLTNPPPPVEIVVKSRYTGTDEYRYVGLQNAIDRFTECPLLPLSSGDKARYPSPYVRFDWRNSNEHVEGDVAMSESLAAYLINVNKTQQLALRTFEVLNRHLANCGVEIWDFCLFVNREGSHIFGEISQDNGRYRKLGTGEALDKDVWRAGGSSENVLEKWKLLTQLTRDYVVKFVRDTFSSEQ